MTDEQNSGTEASPATPAVGGAFDWLRESHQQSAPMAPLTDDFLTPRPASTTFGLPDPAARPPATVSFPDLLTAAPAGLAPAPAVFPPPAAPAQAWAAPVVAPPPVAPPPVAPTPVAAPAMVPPPVAAPAVVPPPVAAPAVVPPPVAAPEPVAQAPAPQQFAPPPYASTQAPSVLVPPIWSAPSPASAPPALQVPLAQPFAPPQPALPTELPKAPMQSTPMATAQMPSMPMPITPMGTTPVLSTPMPTTQMPIAQAPAAMASPAAPPAGAFSFAAAPLTPVPFAGGVGPSALGLERHAGGARSGNGPLDWVAFVLAFLAPPLGLLIGIGAVATGLRSKGYAAGIAKAAIGIGAALSIVLGAAFVVVTKINNDAAAHAAIVASSRAYCAKLTSNPSTLSSDTFGWPSARATIPKSILAMRVYKAKWDALVTLAPSGIKSDTKKVVAAAESIVTRVKSSQTLNDAGNVAQMQNVVATSGIRAWASNYCT